jgi:SdrD B-like domain
LLSASSDLSNIKTGPLRKIGDSLASIYQQYNSATSNAVSAALSTSMVSTAATSNGDVTIEAYANSNGAALAKALGKLDAVDVQTYGNDVSASVPVSELRKVAALPSLRFAEPATYVTNTGSVTSQGDVADQAATVRSALGVTGAGEMVGILSDSFNTLGGSDTYATDVASGDLPSGVQIITDAAGGTDEGRAMAQVIYDSAPGVNFAFETAEGGQAAFAAHINALTAIGAKVIVDDVTYPAEPMFQDGVVAQAVENAISQGVSYFSAAGNLGQDSYASAWRTGNVRANGSITSAAGAPHFFGGTTFNFATSGAVNDMNSFTLGANQSIFLSFQWDSPYFSANGKVGSPNDLDAYVLNSAGQIVGGSATANVGGDPTEVFQFTNNTGVGANFKLMLVWNTASGGPAPGNIKYVDFDGQATNWAFAENSGTIFGHANAAGAIAVGAAAYFDTPAFGVSPPVVESYSSAGTTPIFFNTAGTRITTITRQTPAVVAPDDVDNTFFGSDSDSDGFPNFAGTSASAASAAAVGALLLQQNPHLTPAQVLSSLETTATDMGTPGVDNLTGFGLINATAALSSTVGSVSGTVFQDNNGNGVINSGETGMSGVTVYFDANNDGTLDAGDISTTTNSAGAYTLNFLPVGSDVIRIVVPSGFATTNSPQTISVTAGSSTTGVNLGVFLTDIVSSSSGASYLLENDTTTPANIDIFIGSTLTYSAPKSAIPSLTFNLSGSSSTLTVNYLNGDPLPLSGGVDFIAGSVGSSSGNSLAVVGSNNADIIAINDFLTFPGGDAINIENVQSVNVTGNGGNDSLTLGQSLSATVNYNGGTGTNTLTYNGSADTSTQNPGGPPTDATIAETISVTNTQLSDNTSIVTFSNTQILNVIANLDGDDVVVNMTSGAPPLTITATGVGETVNLNSGPSASAVTVIGTGGGDILDIASGYASPVNFSGGIGDNVLIFNGTTGTNTTTITSTTVSDSVSSVTYATIGFLTVNGVGTSNTFNISSSAPGATVTTTINGGTAVNLLNVNTALTNSGATTFFNGGIGSGNTNTLTVNAGTFQFAGDPQSTSANLTINDNSSVLFAAAAPGTGINARNVTNFNLGANSTAAIIDADAHADRAVLVVNSLSINATAKLDAGGNDIIVHNASQLSQLMSYLTTGSNIRSWNGNGIDSSTAQNNTSRTTALGILLNKTGNAPFYTSFDGVTVGTSDVLIKYTYYGDANLSGVVDATDYLMTDAGFAAKTGSWVNGDYSYDGLINGTDYTLMDNAYNTQNGSL